MAREAQDGHGMGVNGERQWLVKASTGSHDCINPIRQFEENVFRDVLESRRTDMEFIKLSIGTHHQLLAATLVLIVCVTLHR